MMRALSKLHAAPGIWAVETAKPEAGHGEVIVRVCKTGICGTDIHIYKWDAWAQATIPVPMVTGHEFAGEIADIGPGVTNLKLGQRVSAEGHVIGMRSRASRGGRYHLDPETQGIGVTLPGCFAEYVKVPAFNIIALPDDISDEIGAILDPLGNAVHTALSFDIAGEDVLITGAGPIGIMAAAVARHAGARHVVITDINTQRLALAAQVADVVTVNVAEERLEDVMARLRMNEGFDVGLEMSGSPEAFSQMIDLMVMGGRIALLGIPSRPFAIDWNRVVFRMLTIKGIYGREMFETWHKMIAMLQRGLDVSKVVTHRFDAVDFQQGFDAMAAGNSGKIVLDWTGKLPVPLNQPVAQATAERAGA